MIKLHRTEEAAMTLLSIYLIAVLELDIKWWLYLPLFFFPDVGLIGLSLKNKVGTIFYAIFHNKVIAVIVWISGLLLTLDYLVLAGLILFGHSSFDRFLGFELNQKSVP